MEKYTGKYLHFYVLMKNRCNSFFPYLHDSQSVEAISCDLSSVTLLYDSSAQKRAVKQFNFSNLLLCSYLICINRGIGKSNSL